MEASAPLLLTGGHAADGAPVELLLAGARVVAAGETASSHPSAADAGRLDCAGMTLLPAPAEPHAHLDKALLAERLDHEAGDLVGAIRAMRDAEASMSDEDVRDRARRAAQLAVGHGFTAIRSHVDVRPRGRGRPVATLAALRDELRGLLDVQLVALVHDPISGREGQTRRGQLAEALEQGVDVLGGAPRLDGDPGAAVDELTAAAADAGCPIDLHIDETTDVSAPVLERYVQRVEQLGLGGRATASHCVSLGQLELGAARTLARRLANAGVAVVTLPQTNLLLQGRDALTATVRGVAPVRLLEDAGVLVAAGGDNWRDPFNPLGRIDPLETAGLLVAAAHVSPALAYRLVSSRARQVMGLAPADLQVGDAADVLVIAGRDLGEALASASEQRIVIRAGRVVARTEVMRTVDGADGVDAGGAGG